MDAVVVGAGPAGSIAALILARAGVRVRMFDRAEFPRDKLCGDTLNPGSMALLERLGASGGIRAKALALTGMTVTGPGGETIAADYPGGLTGVALTRREMDLEFIEAAVAAGAQVETGVTVLGPHYDNGRVAGIRVRTHGREDAIPARVVIAADGRGSRVASALGLSRFAREPRRWAYGAYFSGVAGLSTHGEMHLRRDGYIGVAPLPGGIANVCVVRPSTRFARSGLRGVSGVADPHATVITEAIDADPVLRERFAGAVMAGPPMVLGPLAIEASAAGCPGLLLAGDAAGFVDPMTGDGLRFALRGAELAAEAAIRELASGAPAWRQLGADRAREFSTKWRLNRTLRGVVGSRRALRVAAAVARRWPASIEYLIGVAGDVSLART
jgi:flavin-dependent dehydrogenase